MYVNFLAPPIFRTFFRVIHVNFLALTQVIHVNFLALSHVNFLAQTYIYKPISKYTYNVSKNVENFLSPSPYLKGSEIAICY